MADICINVRKVKPFYAIILRAKMSIRFYNEEAKQLHQMITAASKKSLEIEAYSLSIKLFPFQGSNLFAEEEYRTLNPSPPSEFRSGANLASSTAINREIFFHKIEEFFQPGNVFCAPLYPFRFAKAEPPIPSSLSGKFFQRIKSLRQTRYIDLDQRNMVRSKPYWAGSFSCAYSEAGKGDACVIKGELAAFSSAQDAAAYEAEVEKRIFISERDANAGFTIEYL